MKLFYRLKFEIKHLIYKLRLFRIILKQDNYFDMDGLYSIISFKAKILRTKGFCLGDTTEKSLRIVEKLANKIQANERTARLHDKLDTKWGKLSHVSIPDGKYYRLEFTREKAPTPELLKQANEEMCEGLRRVDECKARDIKVLFAILGKYIQQMWD